MRNNIDNIQWEYTELKTSSKYMDTYYHFAGEKFSDIMGALHFAGIAGWELVGGYIDGRLILKRIKRVQG